MIELPDLPKWPGLIVKGDPLTQEQTFEIMLRTSDFWLMSNNKEWENQLYAVIDNRLGYQFEGDNSDRKIKRVQSLEKDLSTLNLNYLQNDRIVSSWVGGPHGWLNWDGTVGCCNYNIGKWPSSDDVLKEWETIAEAFPYLNLQCQLTSEEDSDKNREPLIEYTVKDGKVVTSIPTTKLVSNVPYTASVEYLIANMGVIEREQGCTLEFFRQVLDTHLNQLQN